ncbi:MAG: hypothetical protein K2L80_00810 [Muribaculaceae bacterium]|nr:hypothetical protein [Muribaculaceae bacterium]MDE6331121.1 hypothetical protein [Muribaculaceae bacterium]
MKAVFITFDQAHYEHIIDILDRLNCRGFTAWPQVSGRGTRDGEPHYGSHAWPSLAQAIMTIVDDSRVAPLLQRLKTLDNERPRLGLRAFVLPVDQAI